MSQSCVMSLSSMVDVTLPHIRQPSGYIRTYTLPLIIKICDTNLIGYLKLAKLSWQTI